MSYGLAICSTCSREVHADSAGGWFHCADRTPLCDPATSKAMYPAHTSDIRGPWCGCDDFDRKHGPPPRAEKPAECAHAPARTGADAKLANVCRKCGARIARKAPAGAWRAA